MRNALIAALSSLLLCSCALAPQRPVEGTPIGRGAAALETDKRNQFARQIERVAERMRAVCVAPEYKAYFAKTACLPAGITPKMMQDRSKITAAQRKAAEQVFKIARELNDETRRFMIETELPAFKDDVEWSELHVDPQVERLQKELLSGHSTWGEYNTLRRRIADESLERIRRNGSGS